jgi:hypothetical protein
MTCPTLDPITGSNLAGCTGTITVLDSNGNPLPGFTDPIPIGSNLEQLNTNASCGEEFPTDSGLKKFVMGALVQECTSDSDVKTDLVDQQKVRSTNDYFSTTQSFNLLSATCNPTNGFPSGACTNDGGAWITFPAAANGDQCSAANFSCGQVVDDGADEPSPGPPPSTCRIGSSGQCECRCARCTPDGTLVNLSTGEQGLFVLASSENAYACSVTVTGN